MLGKRPHQRLGSVPPLTSVEPGRRFASESIAVMKRRFVPRQTSVCHHVLVPSCAFGIVYWNVASAVSGEMSNSTPTLPSKPGQTPAGGPPAGREETTTDVTSYCEWRGVREHRKARSTWPIVPVEMLAKSLANLDRIVTAEAH